MSNATSILQKPVTPTPRRFSLRRIGFTLSWVLVTLLIVVGTLSALSNLGTPTHSQVVDQLGDLEKARLAEALHLRQTLGNQVWPGWGEVEIPAIVYNEGMVFLVGYPDPPAGWVKVPEQSKRGRAWELVPNDLVSGASYYRQPLLDPNLIPQSFTVLVGDRWVSSLATKEWMVIELNQQVRRDFTPLFPHRLFTRLLIGSSETYIGAFLHESFHAYQGMVAQTKLENSEKSAKQHGADYPVDNPALQDAWQIELNFLADAVTTTSEQERIQLVQQFLTQRADRRTSLGLTADLVAYEQQREWLEGLAKYVELAILKNAAATEGYEPLPVMDSDPDFHRYSTAARYWSQQIEQIRRMADDEDDVRFYYSGMAQAFLLDHLSPNWKVRILVEDVTLEALLAEVVQ